MKNRNTHFVLLTLVLASAYFLSACGGTLPQDNNSNDGNFTPSQVASNTPVIPVASATLPQSGTELEIFGIVESMTETSITINGVTYNIAANLTQFNDVIAVGDQVRILVIVNADGTFTIREIEISIGNDNGNNNANSNENSNVNSNDANNSNTNDNNNANSNDSNNNNSNTNDGNGNESNSNEDNSNDNNGNDDSGNDNDNDSSGPGSGGNDNDDSGGNDNEGNDNG